MLDGPARRRVRGYFEQHLSRRGFRGALSRAYYRDLYGFIRSQVEPGARVLDIGCGDGSLLASLEPSLGVGVDVAGPPLEEARRHHPHLDFVQADAEQLPLKGEFDYIVASNSAGFMFDLWEFLRSLHEVCSPSTRLVLTGYNFAWEPALRTAQLLGLRNPTPVQNWLSRPQLQNLLELGDFEVISSGYRMVLPIGPSVLTRPLNSLLAALPLIRRLGITTYVIARPTTRVQPGRVEEPSTSIIICTRNERGNVRPNVERIPELGSHTEIVFVDGESPDGTAEEIEKTIEDHPDKDIKLIRQGEARGKGDALHMGMAAASGDVLMVLDGDLTVAPEDLTKFWDAIVEEKGEFINGSRLVYPLEKDSMRLANMLGNKLFGLVFSWILDQRMSDTLCANKVLWAADYQRLAERRKIFGEFDPFGDFDLLFGAAALGLRIREVPIRYRARVYGSTNISRWRHGVLLLRMAIKGAFRFRLK